MNSGLMSQALYDQIAEKFRKIDSIEREINKVRTDQQIDRKEEFSATVRNDSGETVPPFAAMEVTGTTLIGNRRIITIQKPTGDPEKPHLFNGTRQIEIGEFGQGFYGLSQVALAGSLSAGTKLGVTDGTWTLSESTAPVARLLGSFSASEGMAVPLGLTNAVNKATVAADTTAGATGDITLSNNDVVTATNWTDCDAVTGDRAFASKDANGDWVYTLCKCCGDGGSGSGTFATGWEFTQAEESRPSLPPNRHATHSYSVDICSAAESTTVGSVVLHNTSGSPLTLDANNVLHLRLIFTDQARRDACTVSAVSDGGVSSTIDGAGVFVFDIIWNSGFVPAAGSITRTFELNCPVEPDQPISQDTILESHAGFATVTPPSLPLTESPVSQIIVTNNVDCS